MCVSCPNWILDFYWAMEDDLMVNDQWKIFTRCPVFLVFIFGFSICITGSFDLFLMNHLHE